MAEFLLNLGVNNMKYLLLIIAILIIDYWIKKDIEEDG